MMIRDVLFRCRRFAVPALSVFMTTEVCFWRLLSGGRDLK